MNYFLYLLMAPLFEGQDTPRPTPPCFSGSLFREHSPKPPSAGSAQPGALLFLTAALRRVIFLCVTLRRTLRNSAVKRTQTHLQPGKTRGFKPGLLTQAVQVLLHQRGFGDPRSPS
jgi:hypothetical protein